MKRIILGADRGDGLIGLWWYTDDCNVIGLSEPVDDGVLDGDYIQFSKGNHMTRWKDVIESLLPDNASNIISKDSSQCIEVEFVTIQEQRAL